MYSTNSVQRGWFALQAFIYNRVWLEETISRLISERRQINNMRETLKYAKRTSPPDCAAEYVQIDSELEGLENSLRQTQEALSSFMDKTERNDRQIRASYEEQNERIRHIFD